MRRTGCPAARSDSACSISRSASRVWPLIVSHSASTASSQARNSAEAGAAARVGAGGAHPVGCLVAAADPAGNECRVRQDRRSEQGVIGFPGGLQRADERRVGVVGLAQVEELDPPGQ